MVSDLRAKLVHTYLSKIALGKKLQLLVQS